MFTLVFFVMSLTAASVSAGSNDMYKTEKAKLDAEKAKLEKEKIAILKEKAQCEKEKQQLEAQKKKLSRSSLCCRQSLKNCGPYRPYTGSRG